MYPVYPQFALITAPLADRPPREDLPLPTSPPYTAFIGNLAFDVTESEMASFFGGHQVGHQLLS